MMVSDGNVRPSPGIRGISQIRSLGRTDLRNENARLRGLLERADGVAARHAMLMREGDHRIKNSLQIISSLMSIQAGPDETSSVAMALRTTAARIRSVARIHDALQASGGEDSLDLGAALSAMCDSLHDMAGGARGVEVHVSSESIHAPVAFSQPVVLAVNELVVNALRHAFPDNASGRICVDISRQNGEVRITVSDNGVGLPPDYSEGRGYGIKLVRMMTEQIGGVLHVTSASGAHFVITAPEPASGSTGR